MRASAKRFWRFRSLSDYSNARRSGQRRLQHHGERSKISLGMGPDSERSPVSEAHRITVAVNPKNFLTELKRRNVYKVAIAYAVVAWLLMQIASQIFPFFDIPNWVVRLVVLLLVIGFPIALIIAWAFELTPEGIKRTEAAEGVRAKPSRNRAWIYVVLIAGAISIGLFFLGRFTVGLRQRVSETVPAKSIAVLPFESLSEDKSNAYFAEGIQDEILTRLAKIADLKVISRTSTQKYK